LHYFIFNGMINALTKKN